MEITFYFCTFLYFISLRRALAAENASESNGCSNHCSQQDKDDTCWKKTEHYYDDTLISAINDWTTVEINVDQWNKRQEISRPNDTDVIERLSKSLPSGSILDLATLQAILPILLNLTYTKSTDSKITIGIPEFVCPIPCNYDSRLWEYLFIASILVNIAMLLVVIPFIIKSERRDKKLYAKQVSMMQMLKPTSKSRNPSSS